MLVAIAIHVALFAFASANTVSKECPDKDLIHPCVCFPSVEGIRLTCSSLKTETEVEIPFIYLASYKMAKLTFANIGFGIRSQLFDNIETEAIGFHDSDVEVLDSSKSAPDTPRTHLDAVEFINSVVNIGENSLMTRDDISTLNFINCRLKTADDTWFAGLRVKNIVFQNVTFDNASKLNIFDKVDVAVTSITVTTSNIQAVNRDFFPAKAPHLTSISLCDNKLETLPDDIFSNMEKLTTVRLAGNRFKTIPEGPFKNLWDQLTLVDFERNPLVCDETLRWLIERRRESMTLSGRCTKPGTDIKIKLSDLTLNDIETQ